MKNIRFNGRIPLLAACGIMMAGAVLPVSCLKEEAAVLPEIPAEQTASVSAPSPQEVACWLASVPFGIEQVREVWAAVTASSANGYDEEYPFSNLLSSPGSGVGDEARAETRSAGEWDEPMRDFLAAAAETRSEQAGNPAPGAFLEALAASGLQIYWPYSEDWDGVTMPLVTFDPERSWDPTTDGAVSNIAYPSGVTVDEETARRRPVWVVNRNEDAGCPTPQTLLRSGGQEVTDTRAGTALRSLTIKRFRAHRNYDSWLAGGSEFWIKCGSVENFTARTEDELRLYSPSVTDFMINVKRKQIGRDMILNAMLVSNWTDQLQDCAFMILEDDGGKRTTWKATAEVKIKSKTYGVNVEFPYNRNDDIVWRGSLTSTYFEKYNGVAGRFGDVSITFAFADR